MQRAKEHHASQRIVPNIASRRLARLMNSPLDRIMTLGNILLPKTDTVNIRGEDGTVNGDSIRRAFEPYQQELTAIATNLALEAERSK